MAQLANTNEEPEFLGRIFPHVEQLAISQVEYIRALERSVQLLQREIENLRQSRRPPVNEQREDRGVPHIKSIAHTAQLIRSYATADQVIGSLQNYIDTRFPVLESGMFLYEPGTPRLAPAVENTSERLHIISRKIDEEGIIDWAFKQQRSFVIPNLAERGDEGQNNIILVPLFLRGTAVGIFIALTTLTALEFENNDLESLTVLAEAAAIAIDNIRSTKEISKMNLRLTSLNQQMIRSAKLASIGELAGSIAHEINNPLQILVGHIQLLESGVGDPGRRIGIIRHQVERIGEITRRLLHFAHNMPGDTSPGTVALEEVVETVIRFVGSQLQRDGIEIEFDNQTAEAIVCGIKTQLEQVLLNIILNARDAMPDGGKLTLALFREPGNMLSISIADTGVGIKAEDIDHIFDSFFTTKPAGKGTGLGLSISREIIRQHSGSIKVASDIGLGTTFKIRLPFMQAAPEIGGEQLTTEPPADSGSAAMETSAAGAAAPGAKNPDE